MNNNNSSRPGNKKVKGVYRCSITYCFLPVVDPEFWNRGGGRCQNYQDRVEAPYALLACVLLCCVAAGIEIYRSYTLHAYCTLVLCSVYICCLSRSCCISTDCSVVLYHLNSLVWSGGLTLVHLLGTLPHSLKSSTRCVCVLLDASPNVCTYSASTLAFETVTVYSFTVNAL